MDTQSGGTISSPNHYISSAGSSTGTSTNFISLEAVTEWGYGSVVGGSMTIKKNGLHPELYFKYIKSKFGMLEKMRLDSRLKKLEKAFNKAVESGQEALGMKFLTQVARETRESAIYAKGVKMFIEREDLVKYKHKIREGHISDTMLKDFTRVIPNQVIKKKEKVKDVFDDFVVYHYWNEESAKKAEKKEKMTPDEKQKMRDPVLFGIIKESNRLYFIADWDDEFCDLSFDELVDVLGKDDEELTLQRDPKLSTNDK